MSDADLVTMLKTDLGISANVYDERFNQYIQSARTQIVREGITLDDNSVDDGQLVVMYAAWLWRCRDNGSGMPRMLRYALNNRLLAEKMKGSNIDG